MDVLTEADREFWRGVLSSGRIHRDPAVER